MPKVLDVGLLDEVQRVSSQDAVTMARRLATVRGWGGGWSGEEHQAHGSGARTRQPVALAGCCVSVVSVRLRQGGVPRSPGLASPQTHLPAVLVTSPRIAAGGGPAVWHQQRRGSAGSNQVRTDVRVSTKPALPVLLDRMPARCGHVPASLRWQSGRAPLSYPDALCAGWRSGQRTRAR